MKSFLTFLFIQLVSYSIVTYSYRAISQGHLPKVLVCDALYASFQFFVIRKIAKAEDSYPAFAGYVVGSLLGSTVGMLA